MSSNDENLWRENELILNRFEAHCKDNFLYELNVYMYSEKGDVFSVYVNFEKYPKLPIIKVLEFPTRLIEAASYLKINENTIKDWKEDENTHVIDQLAELEKTLNNISLLVSELESVKSQFVVRPINPLSLDVRIPSYSQIVSLTLNCKEFPKRPEVTLEGRKAELVNTESYNQWNSHSHLLDLLGEIEYNINQEDRLPFEIEKLKNICRVNFNTGNRQLIFEIEGRDRFKGQKFTFSVEFPENYPKLSPEIKITTTIIDSSLEDSFNQIVSFADKNWNPNWFLEDIVLKLKLSVLNMESKYDCWIDRRPIDNLDDAIKCPSCGQPFHKDCWEVNKKKAGYCPKCLART